MIYLNNAGTSWPKPDPVHHAIATALRAEPEQATEIFELSRRKICNLLGVPDPERTLLTPGCTSALAVAIEDLPWRPGDGIVSSSLEHHALVRPIDRLVRSRGVVHHASPYRPGEPFDLNFLRRVLRDGGVRLVAVTAASNVTGEILPIPEIIALARENEALCLVDAAQVAGVLPLEVSRLEPDILALAGHKGPLGPSGIGVLWARHGIEFESPRATCELTAGASCSPFPTYCDVGSANLPAAAGLAAGLEWLDGPGREAPARARRLARRLVSEVSSRRGIEVYGGAECDRTAIVSLKVAGLPLEEAEEFFRDHSIVLRAGTHCAPMALEAIGAPQGTIRVSFGAFNEEPDVQALLEALDGAASRT